jgi:hypothetical protein
MGIFRMILAFLRAFLARRPLRFPSSPRADLRRHLRTRPLTPRPGYHASYGSDGSFGRDNHSTRIRKYTVGT